MSYAYFLLEWVISIIDLHITTYNININTNILTFLVIPFLFFALKVLFGFVNMYDFFLLLKIISFYRFNSLIKLEFILVCNIKLSFIFLQRAASTY